MSAAEGAGLPKDAYAKAFVNGPNPRASHAAVQTRLRNAAVLNEAVADYFRERALVEAAYVAGLQKIGKKTNLSLGADVLGGFAPSWHFLLNELTETAQVHSSLSKKMTDDIELGVRKMSQKGEWARLNIMDSSLEKNMKTLESAYSKLSKAEKKAGSSKKAKNIQELSESRQDLDEAETSWAIEAPAIFNSYQAADVGRLESLKELVVKYETIRSDAAGKIVESAEQAIGNMISWDTMAEVEDFIIRKGTGGVPGGATATSLSNGTGTASRSDPVRTNTMTSQDAPSINVRSPSIRRNTNNDFGLPTTSSAGGAGLTTGLKSVFGRNKNRDRAGSTATGGSTRSGNNGRPPAPHSSSSFGMLGDEDGPEPATRGTYGNVQPTPSAMVAANYGTSTNGAVRSSSNVDSEGFSVPPPDHANAPWESATPAANLMDDDDDNAPLSSLPLGGQVPVADAQSKNMTVLSTPIQESEADQQAALAKVQSTLLSKPPGLFSANNTPTRRGTVARGRREVRQTTFGIPNVPGVDEMGMPIRSVSGASSFLGGTLGPSSNGVSPTSGSFPHSAVSDLSMSARRQDSSISQLSATPSAISSINPFDGPASGTGTGLRSAITETVNVMSRQGEVSRVVVSGEIAFTFPATLPPLPSNILKIKLDSFQELEKIAPNPTYVVANSGEGEYSIDVAKVKAFIEQGGNAAGNHVVLFKYQLFIPPGQESDFLPIVVKPAWKCDDTETKILINYSLNKNSKMCIASPSLEFDSLAFQVPISSSSISTPQSKPLPGNWNPSTSIMTYPAPLSTVESVGKIAARMGVSEKTVPKTIHVKWRLEGGITSNLGLSLQTTDESAETLEMEIFKTSQSGKFMVD